MTNDVMSNDQSMTNVNECQMTNTEGRVSPYWTLVIEH